MKIIAKYGIVLRLVETKDAELILKLRIDERLSKYISPTSTSIDAQKEWIKKYKERESCEKEFYFVAEYLGTMYGTTRIYNIEDDCFEVGSWLFSPDTPSGISILTDIIGREFAFEKFGVTKCKYEVRKNNLTVVKYHQGYKPTMVGEDELNYYFELDKKAFENHKNKLIKILSK